MKIRLRGQQILANVKTGIDNINSVTINLLSENKYETIFFGDSGKRVRKVCTKVEFEGIKLTDRLWPTYREEKYWEGVNGKYINFYPQGTKIK